MQYKFKFRRKWFWKTLDVVGHKYDEKQDKMIIYLKKGGLQEIKNWKNCEVKLGMDWMLETKKEMEKTVGQNIPMDVGN